MNRLRALSFVFPILGLTAFTANAQSRKEVIEKMTVQVDSLQKKLAQKTENIHALEVKLAKLEGSQEANAELIKRLETKSDSLTLKLISKTDSLNSLNSEIQKLNADITGLKSSGDTLLAKNEALQKQLEVHNQKALTKAPQVNSLPADNSSNSNNTRPLETAKPEVAVKKD